MPLIEGELFHSTADLIDAQRSHGRDPYSTNPSDLPRRADAQARYNRAYAHFEDKRADLNEHIEEKSERIAKSGLGALTGHNVRPARRMCIPGSA